MRIDATNPADRRRVDKVFVNDIEVERGTCLEADDEKGYAVVLALDEIKYDAEGRRKSSSFPTRRLTGDVRITFRDG